MEKRLRKLLAVLFTAVVMAAPALACSVFLGGPEAPSPQITPTQDVPSIEKSWSDATSSTSKGTVIVIFDEAQLTAYLQEKLNANPDNNFHSVQVFLRDGRIKVYGILGTGYFSASVLISLRPEVTAQGGINLVVEQAKVGPIDLPGGLLSTLSDILTEAFTGQVGSLATGFQVQEILVGDGKIAIRGVLR
jgi:hypothetical protein